MIRNLKALGLALVAVFAMSAMAASTALAEDEGTFTADEYPAHIVGKDTIEGHLKGPGLNVTCKVAEYTGEITHAQSTVGVHNLTIEPNYDKCETTGNPERGVTVTMHGCDYTFYNASDTEEVEPGTVHTTSNEWTLTTDLDCPGTEIVEVHVYKETLHNSGQFCTITIDDNNNKGLEGLTATNDTKAEDINVHGSVVVKAQTHGTCSAGLTLNINTTLEVTNATIEATNELGEPLGVEIS